MAMMKMVVFDTEKGQCVFIRTPNDYGILIDCAKGNPERIASPVEWLAENEAPSLQRVNDHTLAALIVTHPKADNLQDINAAIEKLSPAMVWCDADCRSLLSGVEPDNQSDVDLDVKIDRFSLSNEEAEQDIDNRSIVTVITYNSAEGYTWKVVVSGDNTTEGWARLLAKPEFVHEIEEADFFVTSRNGQEPGFCAELFKVMGKPIANISTGAEADADKRYAKQAQGVKFPDGSRKHLVTGGDGNITVEMHDDGRYDVWLLRP